MKSKNKYAILIIAIALVCTVIPVVYSMQSNAPALSPPSTFSPLSRMLLYSGLSFLFLVILGSIIYYLAANKQQLQDE